MNKAVLAFLFAFLALGSAQAGNDALAQPQTVLAGERVAQYLQAMMISVSAILETKKPGDLISGPEVYRVAVTYDPQDKLIELSVVGAQNDPKIARDKLEMTLKLALSFNKKIQRNFGVTLSENDLSMDFLDAKTSQIIVRYRGGQFEVEKDIQAEPTHGYVGSLEH